MDSVLSRKLFREKYIEEIKPQKFNQGGIAILKFNQGGEVFSEGEKLGYMLAPVAAQLLQAKQRPGQSALSSLFGAVGEGVSQIPAIGLDIKRLEIASEKNKEKATAVVPLTPELIAKLPASWAETINPRDRGVIEIKQVGDQLIPVKAPTITSKAEDRDERIAKAAKDTGMLNSYIALDTAESIIDEVYKKTGNIPGFGTGAVLPDWLAGKEGKEARNAVTRLTNITLKDRSGAAVTTPEFERAKAELAIAVGKTDKDLLFALKGYRDQLNGLSGIALSGFDQRDLNDFFQSGGGPLKQKESPFTKYLTSDKQQTQTQAQPFSYKVKKSGDKNIIKIETD